MCLGLVIGLILLVVLRMVCASWQGRGEQEKKRQKREESRQRKIDRALRKTEENNHKNSVEVPERGMSEEDSREYDGHHVPSEDYNHDLSQVTSESVRGQVAGPSTLVFPTYEQISEGHAPVPYAQFRHADRSSVYV